MPIQEKHLMKLNVPKNCDFLLQSKNVLAWTNDKEAKLNNMLGTGEDFILTEYNSERLS